MVILGLDPGIARCGFGVVEMQANPRYLRSGCITTPAHLAVEDRLVMLGADVEKIITDTSPALAVIEQIYFGANAKTAMLTAQARGVILYVLRQHHIPIEHVTPLQIKSRLTGYGSADKHQVQQVITRRLGLDAPPQPDDAADAVAAALCANLSPITNRL